MPDRKFDRNDLVTIAEFVIAELSRRKKKPDRVHLEKVWKEVDRQIRMEFDKSRFSVRGKRIPGTDWMPSVELPLQAQSLEVLTADSRRMLFPGIGSYFAAHAGLTTEYESRVDFESIIAGVDAPSQIVQENADKLLEGWILNHQRQYGFADAWDVMNGEAFKYGTMVGRGRVVTKEVFLHTSKGVVKKKTPIPVLFPVSIKNTYLDDTRHFLMNEGQMIGGSTISTYFQSAKDVKLSASKGGTSPDNMDGGWMPGNLKDLEPHKDNTFELVEFEGDLVVPRKTVRDLFLPNVIVTIVVGKQEGRVIRLRFNPFPFTTYLTQPYQVEDVSSPYGTGSLMKGMPIQKAATEAFNRLMQWSILNTEPPIKYDRSDPYFAAHGGPQVYPRAQWPTLGIVEPVEIGDGAGLLNVYLALLTEYFDVVGVNRARLGDKTTSHTTAFAKDVELTRGTVRTVDYAESVIRSPLHRWLTMEFEMGKASMEGEETFFIPDYGGFVSIEKRHLPDFAAFETFGAAGPAEDRLDEQKMIQALQLAFQVDQLDVQMGGQPLNYAAIKREILRKGGFTDVDTIIAGELAQSPADVEAGPGIPAVGAPDTRGVAA